MTRILVVDDELKLLSFVSRALTAHGFSVDTAPDGDTGLALIQSGHYDLVVLDLKLPPPNGLAILKATMRAHPNQRVLVLSAIADAECRVRCLELGAVDYLCKPFSVAELASRIQLRLREPAQPVAPRRLQIRDLALDVDRRRAFTGGRRVQLSTREFLLLEYLMRHAGKVCTREDILEHVWGYTFDPGTNVVDVYVRRLRGKIGHDAIETVRNVGYSVDAA